VESKWERYVSFLCSTMLVSFYLLGKVSKNAYDITILRLCVCVCVCVCACVRTRERQRENSNSNAMSDERFPQRSIGCTGPIEMPPRSPDSTRRLLSSVRYSRTAYCWKPRNVGETKGKARDFMDTEDCAR
jgi:hypothetical protein